MENGTNKWQVLASITFPKSNGPLDHEELIEQAKSRDKDVVRALSPLDPGLVAVDMKVTRRDSYENPLRVVRPSKAPANGSPLIFCVHGGSFNAGTPLEES